MLPSPSAFWRLKNFELFENINPKDGERIAALMTHSHLKKNDVIYAEGEKVHHIFILKEGRIKILYDNQNADETMVELLQEGDIFGKLNLNNEGVYEDETAIIATERAFVCSLEVKQVELLIHTIPQLAVNYTKILAEKLKTMEHKYALFLKKDIRSRLANFFIMHSLYEGRQKGSAIEIQGFLTHNDIARFIGTSRQTATTLINEMETAGVIKFIDNKKILIPDIEKLKKI